MSELVSPELVSPLLSAIPWLRHGFGTRSAPLSQNHMASLQQIHSALVLVARQTGRAGDGDALVSGQPGLALSIRTADCYPILLADTAHRGLAAVHAGWRGTAAGIVAETLTKMREEFGTAPADVAAAIGPGIGACCYEVGEDVARQFGMSGPGKLDLAAENVRQLITAGVPRERVDVLGLCTFCDPERFFSWRRDHDTRGRMISYIAVS